MTADRLREAADEGTALERVRRYLDAREFMNDDIYIGSPRVSPVLYLADLREVIRMASEGVR